MRKRNIRNVHISFTVCPECENVYTVPRVVGRERSENHVKDMWCVHCKKTQKMREVRHRDVYIKKDGAVLYGY